MKQAMFHSVSDGKGKRRVFVNGNAVKRVLWANVEQGLVCFYPYPYRINNRKNEVQTMLLRGQVTVEFINEAN
ncbi:hypothetical protein [Acinetobacter baumannii]|uniref:hypothetical protein n=1 Tax=Acinetobacter baumannii TaxID=470 RepID=UPI00338F191C